MPAGSTATSRRRSLVDVRDLAMHFPIRRGMFGRTAGHVQAVDGVDLTIQPGETLGLVGESGCGKTTLGRCIARVDATDRRAASTTAGERHRSTSPRWANRICAVPRGDPGDLPGPVLLPQPADDAAQIVGEPLRTRHISQRVRAGGPGGGDAAPGRPAAGVHAPLSARVLRWRAAAGQHRPGADHRAAAGDRGRGRLARWTFRSGPRSSTCSPTCRTSSTSPTCSSPTTSPSWSTVRPGRGDVPRHGSWRRPTPMRSTPSPHHPYTEALLSAVPRPDPRLRDAGRQIRLSDDFPDPSNPPPGCFFHTRCHYGDGTRCQTEHPALRSVTPDHDTACHHSEELELAGVTTTGRRPTNTT